MVTEEARKVSITFLNFYMAMDKGENYRER